MEKLTDPGTHSWLLRTCLLDFKDILNSRQNNSKNKLVGENAVHVTRVPGSC